MKKYEYTFVNLSKHTGWREDFEELEKILNKMGLDGWKYIWRDSFGSFGRGESGMGMRINRLCFMRELRETK